MKKINFRNLHRDLGYFYVGLIISFATSGILMNHRDSWHAEKYTVETKAITIDVPAEKEITDQFAENLGKSLGIDDKLRRQNVKEGNLKISFQNHDIEVNIKTGKGELVSFIKTPIISQMMKLHKNTSNWWIYYGDIFGISLITIAITGMIMIPAGKFSFKRRGWKLAVAGLIFPLLILLLLN
jgi:hypothetical protein